MNLNSVVPELTTEESFHVDQIVRIEPDKIDEAVQHPAEGHGTYRVTDEEPAGGERWSFTGESDPILRLLELPRSPPRGTVR